MKPGGHDDGGDKLDLPRDTAVAAYIAELVAELSTMAQSQGLSILAYILEMARREAEARAEILRRS